MTAPGAVGKGVYGRAMSEPTTFKARIPGNDRTGHFTQQACESLVGQDHIHLGNTGEWNKVAEGKGRVVAAELDGPDVIVTIEVTHGAVPAGIAADLGTVDAPQVSCGFVVPDRAAAVSKDLSRIRLLNVWPEPAQQVTPGTATEMPAAHEEGK